MREECCTGRATTDPCEQIEPRKLDASQSSECGADVEIRATRFAKLGSHIGHADLSRARFVRVHRRPLTGSTAGITPVFTGAGRVEKKWGEKRLRPRTPYGKRRSSGDSGDVEHKHVRRYNLSGRAVAVKIRSFFLEYDALLHTVKNTVKRWWGSTFREKFGSLRAGFDVGHARPRMEWGRTLPDCAGRVRAKLFCPSELHQSEWLRLSANVLEDSVTRYLGLTKCSP
jgi:hypothetical protein